MPGSRLLAFSLAALLGGCVVPVAPKWSDPDNNYPPSIDSAQPPVGTILGLGVDGGAPFEVSVSVADQNTNDTLYFHWIIDYPPYVLGMYPLAYKTEKPGGSSLVRTPVTFSPSCKNDRISPGLSSHRLMLAVSDRPFDESDESVPDAVTTGHLVRAVWPFEMTCP
jgi:hypothetical protein